MKLELFIFDEVSIIQASEGMSAENVSVIMAGVRKLKDANPALMLLDLLMAQPSPPALQALKAVRSHPAFTSLGLKMITSAKEISDFPDYKTAIGSQKTKIGPKILEWIKLKIEHQLLKQKEADMAQRLSGRSLSEESFQLLVRKNAALKKANAVLATRADDWLKSLHGLKIEHQEFKEQRAKGETVRMGFLQFMKEKGIIS